MKTALRLFGIVVAALAFAGAAEAKIPLINASCPGKIEVHADEGGPVYINGKEAKLKVFNENYYEVHGAGVTISLSINPDGSPSVSYTGKGGANGVCTLK
ncbi:hypothetical protein PWG15_11570 [Ensifer adhaerens]|uniref:hypothetical protein n=1 Tax=Ensifer adhaerens TaxID=106592 RepID=UPI0023A9BECE|nr:hypothetical protein [Ensifer adhaerens]WDZ75257.1 hypothetical protein PWG15_11570 [Ensifer adhaerens]